MSPKRALTNQKPTWKPGPDTPRGRASTPDVRPIGCVRATSPDPGRKDNEMSMSILGGGEACRAPGGCAVQSPEQAAAAARSKPSSTRTRRPVTRPPRLSMRRRWPLIPRRWRTWTPGKRKSRRAHDRSRRLHGDDYRTLGAEHNRIAAENNLDRGETTRELTRNGSPPLTQARQKPGQPTRPRWRQTWRPGLERAR